MKKYFFFILFILSVSQYLLAQTTNPPKPAKYTTLNGIKLYLGQPKENVFSLLSPKYDINISDYDSLVWQIQIKSEEIITKIGTHEEIEYNMGLTFKNNRVSHISKQLYLHIGKRNLSRVLGQ